MASYRCRDCGTEVFSGDNLSGGSIRLPCPNRQCASRRMNPPKKQVFTFTQTNGVGQKALRGSARRDR